MHRCEFCHDMFDSRPQVKRPRACPRCQDRRQRENEKAWRSRHKGLYDSGYHQILKRLRLKKLRDLARRIQRLIEIGRNFLEERLDLGRSEELLFGFFVSLGIRQINKFWPELKPLDSQ